MTLNSENISVSTVSSIPRKKPVVIYIRVSTSSRSRYGNTLAFDQRPEVQEEPLRRMAEIRGWEVTKVYTDRTSGAAESRPALDSMMADARRGLFQSVMVWRFDRFARSAKHLVAALEEFQRLGIEFVSHQEAIDTGSPMGRAMFTVIAAMAQLEREIIAERVAAGLEHARKVGTRSGKPIGRPRRIFCRNEVVRLRESGLSWSQVAARTGLSDGTVRRAFAASRTAAGPAKTPEDKS